MYDTRIKKMVDMCKWTLDDNPDYVVWQTECGEAMQFEAGGPKENNFVFCPFCGSEVFVDLEES